MCDQRQPKAWVALWHSFSHVHIACLIQLANDSWHKLTTCASCLINWELKHEAVCQTMTITTASYMHDLHCKADTADSGLPPQWFKSYAWFNIASEQWISLYEQYGQTAKISQLVCRLDQLYTHACSLISRASPLYLLFAFPKYDYTWKQKNGENRVGLQGIIHHVADVRWTQVGEGPMTSTKEHARSFARVLMAGPCRFHVLVLS